MKTYLSKNRTDFIIIFIFLILPFIFFNGSMRLNTLLLGMRDSQYVFFPAHELVSGIIKDLELPLWNRYVFSGYPLLSSPSYYAFYPVTIISGLIFPTAVSYNLSVLLHYSLAGIFMYLFMKEYGTGRLASFTAGMIFMFSGSLITNRDHITRIFTFVWIPLILLFLEKFRKTKRKEYLLIASIPYAVSYFAGDPQIFLYGSIIILLYIIFYALIFNGVRNYFFFLSLLIFPLCILMVCVQLIPSYIMSSYSFRNQISYTYFSDFSFNPRLHPVLIFPFFFGRGSFVIGDILKYFSEWNAGEMIKYFGISTIPLFIAGWFKKAKHKYLWIFIAALAVFLVFGRHNELYEVMYSVPLYNKFRVPARNWFEFGLAFSVLAGFGLDFIIKGKSKRIKWVIIGAAGFIAAVLLKFTIFYLLFRRAVGQDREVFLSFRGKELVLLSQNLEINNFSVFVPVSILIITIILFIVLIFRRNKTTLGILAVFIFIDLFSFGHFMDRPRDITYINNKVEESSDLEYLKDEDELFRIYPLARDMDDFVFYPNANIHYGLESIIGHDPVLLKDYGNITGVKQDPDWSDDYAALLKNNVIISMLNTKYIILPSVDDTESLFNEINKNVYKYSKKIFDQNEYSSYSGDYESNFTTTSELKLSDPDAGLEVFSFPISINSDKSYLIDFMIRKDNGLDNNISFDFYGPQYDQPEQEFYLSPEDLDQDYTRITRVLNSGTAPSDTDIAFRVFTNSKGNIWIKDLIISEIEITTENNYGLILERDDILVLENKKFLPRFYFVERVWEVEDLQKIKNILMDENQDKRSDFDLLKTAIVEAVDFNQKKFDYKGNLINLLSYKNNSVSLEVELEDDGFMVFSDNYYPGWRSFIDGKEVKIYRVNGILKGIYIDEGRHEILFKYRPPYFALTFPVSISALLIIIALAAIMFLKNKKKNER
jgi:hypothetical protein